MKLLVLTITDDIIHGQEKPLTDSLIRNGYDYEVFLYGFIFGEQYKVIKTFVDQYKGEATHILYTDAWDTLALGRTEELINKFEAFNCKMLISTEKACFPNDIRDKYHKPDNYPETKSAWKYINGGGCMFEIEYFKELCALHPFNKERMMDPDWLAELYLSHPDQIKLDNECEIFQCLSHSNQDEWELKDNRIMNKETQSKPIFFHHNGIKDRREVQWVYDLTSKEA